MYTQSVPYVRYIQGLNAGGPDSPHLRRHLCGRPEPRAAVRELVKMMRNRQILVKSFQTSEHDVVNDPHSASALKSAKTLTRR